jgi:hypothetical protein
MTAPRAVRLAVVLWLLFAFAVWNVIFDRTLVLAGRRYVWAATIAARHGGPFLRIDDWMRPAIAQGIRVASAVSGAIVVISMAAIYAAQRRDRTAAPREETRWPASPTR